MQSTPTTDAHAIPPALPPPAGAVVLARANAGLSELVLGKWRALSILASCGCTDRTHRRTSMLLRSAALRGISSNVARRTEPTSRG